MTLTSATKRNAMYSKELGEILIFTIKLDHQRNLGLVFGSHQSVADFEAIVGVQILRQ